MTCTSVNSSWCQENNCEGWPIDCDYGDPGGSVYILAVLASFQTNSELLGLTLLISLGFISTGCLALGAQHYNHAPYPANKNEKRHNGFIFLVNSRHIHTEKLKFQACALKTDKLVPMMYVYHRADGTKACGYTKRKTCA